MRQEPKVWTVVYLAANKYPRTSHTVEYRATSADEAMFFFVNDPRLDNDFIACVVEGPRDLVNFAPGGPKGPSATGGGR